MKHAVRKVEGDKREELGFGVFPAYLVRERPISAVINIGLCSEIDDPRPLHVQGKAFRLLGLYPTEAQAKAVAQRLDFEGRLGA